MQGSTGISRVLRFAGKALLIVLAAFVIYLLLGMLIPPLFRSVNGAAPASGSAVVVASAETAGWTPGAEEGDGAAGDGSGEAAGAAGDETSPGMPPSGKTAGERVLCVDDNGEALLWRLRMIEAAQHTIVLSTFDLREDESGRDVFAALLDAAERGVEIRLIVDGGNSVLHLSDSACLAALLACPTVQARQYNAVNLLAPWTGNYRLHDKYLIVDDFAYLLGGRNTFDLFLGSTSARSNIDRDVLVVCETPGSDTSLAALACYFTEVWDAEHNKPLAPSVDADAVMLATQELHGRFAELSGRIPELDRPFSWLDATMPAASVTLLANATVPNNKQPVLWEALCSYLREGSDIAIQTPYLMLGQRMYRDLADLCSDGRSITVYTNSAVSGANVFGCAEYLYSRRDLLGTGILVSEYAGERSLHTKTLLIDENLCIVGSFNFDMRSAYLDTELMLAIDCPELNAELRGKLADTAEQSRLVSAEGVLEEGERFGEVQLSFGKRCLYLVVGLLTRPIRYLL